MAQILPPLQQMGNNAALDLEQTRILVYKLFTRVWSAYCKTLIKEVLTREKTMVCPVLGIFSPMRNLNSFQEPEYVQESDANASGKQVCYMPS